MPRTIYHAADIESSSSKSGMHTLVTKDGKKIVYYDSTINRNRLYAKAAIFSSKNRRYKKDVLIGFCQDYSINYILVY